jgi:PAS domain S-box-containing protein/diguanylate cyclase (GGDEF)-like protein
MNSSLKMQADSQLAEALLTDALGDTPSEQWLSALLSALPTPAAIVDGTLGIVAANAPLCALLKRSAGELAGAPCLELLGMESWDSDPQAPQLPLELKQSLTRPARIRRSDGSLALAQVTLSRIAAPAQQPVHLLTLHKVRTAHRAPHSRQPLPYGAQAAMRVRLVTDLSGVSPPLSLVLPAARGGSAHRLLERVRAAIRRDLRTGKLHNYIVPVPYALLDDTERAAAFLAVCGKLQRAVRERLILMLDEPPPDLAHERLVTMLESLRPFARTLALSLASLAALSPRLETLGLGLIALPTDGLADGFRVDALRLRLRCAALRAAGVALLSRDCATQADTEFARRLRLNFVCYCGDPSRLPPTRLFALSGVEGHSGRMPALPQTAIIEATDSGIVYVDATHPDQPIVRVNPALLAITGYAEHEVLGRNCRFLQGPDTDPTAVARIGAALSAGEPVRCELLNYRKDGTAFWNQVAISPVRDTDGRIIAFAGTLTDVTLRRKTQEAHDQFVQILDGIADTVPGFIYQLTRYADGRLAFTYLGRSAASLFGFDPDVPLAPHEVFALMLPPDRPRVLQRWRRSALTLSSVDLEFTIDRPDGERRWLRSRARPVRRANGETVWNGVTLDVTPEKTARAELSYLRDHDPLTQLPNAQKFHAELTDYLHTARQSSRSATLFMIDVVRFHEINDTYGIAKGDQILTLIATRLHAAFPAGSRFYRMQADQFAVLGAHVESEDSARQIATRAAAILSAPFAFSEGSINLPVRIGLCFEAAGPPAAARVRSATEFAQHADIALHVCKRAARPGISLYSSAIDDRLRAQVIVKQSLCEAIERGEFELYYQPIVHLRTARVLAAEALVRWNHPLLGVQTPASFIPIAEESGLIGPLGEWILRDALHAVRRCRAAGLPLARVSVNVSGVQIADPVFLRTVQDALADSGIDPRMLELELTETVLIEQTAETSHALGALRQLGVQVAIDDFGAGHSSLHYLRHLPVDRLKLDRSFIQDLRPGTQSQVSILKAIVSMARGLDMDLVIEGVETAFQRDLLLSIGCEMAQGYLFSRPKPLADLMRLLSEAPTPRVAAS